MQVEDILGGIVQIADLDSLCARYPWVRQHQPVDLAEGLEILAQTASTLVPVAGQALSKAEGFAGAPSAFEAVRWLVGMEPFEPAAERRALVAEDGDSIAAALSAYRQPTDPSRRAAVSAWMRSVACKPANSESVDVKMVTGDESVAGELTEAAKAGHIRRIAGDQLLARCDAGQWILRRCDRAEQATAFYEVARSWGMAHQLLPTASVMLDGERYVAQHPAPKDCSPMDSWESSNAPRLALAPLLRDGSLHRWAVLDYVLGNPDRLGYAVLISERSACFLVRNEGAFAEKFIPATDGTSFAPAYMRVWAEAGWGRSSAAQKVARWPTAGSLDGVLGAWLAGLRDEPIRLAGAKRGLDFAACCQRLEQLRREVEVNGFGLALARAWCG